MHRQIAKLKSLWTVVIEIKLRAEQVLPPLKVSGLHSENNCTKLYQG